MLKHIVMWRFADDLDEAENRENAIKIKAGVEELRYEMDGVVSLEVHIAPLAMPGCDADMCAEAVFSSRDAFRAFIAHPRYKALREFIADRTGERMCMDFELPLAHGEHHVLQERHQQEKSWPKQRNTQSLPPGRKIMPNGISR